MDKDIDCGALRGRTLAGEWTLAGWVHRRRDHGGLVFMDLRDRSGVVQVVVNPEQAPEAHAEADRARSEWVLQVVGEVGARPGGTENPRLPTGEVEVMAREVRVLNPSQTPPFYINEEGALDEYLALRHRYLYLRRPSVQSNLMLRHRIVKFIRDFLDERDFIEIETPILIKSTPEGARDYLVPADCTPASSTRCRSRTADEAAADGGGLRAVLPDRPLLPRRGPARRPAAGVLAAGPGDELRRARGRAAAHGGAVRRHGGRRDAAEAGAADAVSAAGVRRRDGALRDRLARPAVRAGAGRPVGHRRSLRVPGLPAGGGTGWRGEGPRRSRLRELLAPAG